MAISRASPSVSSAGVSRSQTAEAVPVAGTVNAQVLPMPRISAPPECLRSFVAASAKPAVSLRSLPAALRTVKPTVRLLRLPALASGKERRTAATRRAPGLRATTRPSPLVRVFFRAMGCPAASGCREDSTTVPALGAGATLAPFFAGVAATAALWISKLPAGFSQPSVFFWAKGWSDFAQAATFAGSAFAWAKSAISRRARASCFCRYGLVVLISGGKGESLFTPLSSGSGV